MANPTCPVPDRRGAPRAKVHLDCQVLFEGDEYDAVIQDISLLGAFLWSSFTPPHDATVSIRLKPAFMEDPIILEGNVVRRDCKQTEKGPVGAFAITFGHNSPGLLRLIDRLINPQLRTTP